MLARVIFYRDLIIFITIAIGDFYHFTFRKEGIVMAVFRNRDKRRPWETKEQKRERNFWEAGVVLEHRTNRMLSSIAKGFSKHLAEHPTIGEHAYLEGCHPLEDILRARKNISSVQWQITRKRVSALRPVKEETWAEYFHFGLTFYRLCKWLRSLWATANFRRPSLWMTKERFKKGGRHEIITN